MNAKGQTGLPRVALVSVGLGQIQRGFERYFSDLFEVLRDHLPVTLFKSGGAHGAQEKIPRLLRPTRAILRAVPLNGLTGRSEYPQYKPDCAAFGLSLLPELWGNRFDVIHCIDPPLAAVLQRLQRMFRLPGRLLFTEGSLMPPPYYPPEAHVHHVALAQFQEAVAMGIPESRMTMVPCGIHAERFDVAADRHELRRKYGVAESTFVILAVTAVKRIHKRVHYLIEEVSGLEGDFLLWIDGNPADPAVPELAREKLGSRCRITHLPSSDLPELYRLADVLVHAALEESFGLAVVEALASGLPVLAHDSPHFEWLIGDRNCLVDMRVSGKLAARLHELAARRDELAAGAQTRATRVRRAFDWRGLTPAYVEMYRKVAALPSRLT
ncbi:MAG: glycosyltransferase family 4 protein [Terriglobia bacterium]